MSFIRKFFAKRPSKGKEKATEATTEASGPVTEASMPNVAIEAFDDTDYARGAPGGFPQRVIKPPTTARKFEEPKEIIPFMEFPREMRDQIYEDYMFNDADKSIEWVDIMNIKNEQVQHEASKIYLLRTEHFHLKYSGQKEFLERLSNLPVKDPFKLITGIDLRDPRDVMPPPDPGFIPHLKLAAMFCNLRRLDMTLYSTMSLFQNLHMAPGKYLATQSELEQMSPRDVILKVYDLKRMLDFANLEIVRITGNLPYRSMYSLRAQNTAEWERAMGDVWEAGIWLREAFERKGQLVVFQRRYRFGVMDHRNDKLTEWTPL